MTEVLDAGLDAGIEELTDADLKAAIPCQSQSLFFWEARKAWAFVKYGGDSGYRTCGKPSVARLRISCGRCGARYHLFLCRRCANRFRRGLLVACRGCRRGGKCRGTDS